jgi:predicted ATPase/DNA-binding SARP family transcriptional activator
MLHIYLFGPLRVLGGSPPGGAAHPFHGLPKTLPLWAYLLLHRTRALKRDRLAFTFWPDAREEGARTNLRRHLHDLRRALPAPPPAVPWLLVEGDTVQWNPDAPYWLDVAEFERLSATPEGLAAAVPLYTEDLLPEVYDDWIFFERERLRNLLFASLERLIAQYQARGDFKRAIGCASQILRHDPLREETARLLMTLHHRAGDRNAALQEYRRIERVLRDELGAPPMPETEAAYQAILRGAAPPIGLTTAEAAPARSSGNLPAQVTPFIGREDELAELLGMICPAKTSVRSGDCERPSGQSLRDFSRAGLGACRLVTITGAGGSGKTRLSIELAGRALAEAPGCFPDGAWFVSLSPLSDASLVIPAVADALGVQETARTSLLEDVKNNLRHKRLLLVLDNFEHVTAVAPAVGELLAAAPGLSIIVTSRAILRLYGEQEYPLAPLPLPDPVRLPLLADLARSPAVALFVERARAAAPSFRLTRENAPAVAEICVRLDGLPLALELAAARARLFAPQAMRERLESGLPLLAARARDLPARQSTLRATIDWSFNLLSAAERELFARLSVFAGGFTLAAAEEVMGEAAPADATLDHLSALVEQSMLRTLPAAEPEHAPRFRMLTLLREYAGERLAAQGELETMRRRHARHYLAFAQQGDRALRSPGQFTWLKRLEAEHDNLRAALAWAIERPAPDAHLGLATAAALGWFWYIRGHWSEGNEWLARARAAAPGATAGEQAAAAKSHALMLSALGRYDEAIPLFRHSLDLTARHPDPIRQGDALNWLGRAEFRQKRYETAEAFSREALAPFRQAGDRFGEATALRNIGDVMRLVGRYEEAEGLFQQAMRLSREIGGGWALGMTLNSVGELLRRLGRYARAAEVYDEEIGLHRTLGNRIQLATALHNQGHAVLRLGNPARAAALFGESLRLHQSMDNRRGVCLCLAGLAGVAAETGHDLWSERAARLLAAVGVHLTPMGAHLMGPADQSEYDDHLATVRAALSPQAFEQAWTAGRALTFEQAVALGSQPN